MYGVVSDYPLLCFIELLYRVTGYCTNCICNHTGFHILCFRGKKRIFEKDVLHNGFDYIGCWNSIFYYWVDCENCTEHLVSKRTHPIPLLP